MENYLPAKPPFLLPSVIQSHGWFMLPPFETDEKKEILSTIDRLKTGRVVEYHLQPAENGVILVTAGNLEQEEYEEITNKVKWMLDLDRDFSPFYQRAQSEPKLQRVTARAQGRILRCPSLFEDIVKTLLTTNTLWAATIRMTKNLVTLYGSPLADNPSRHAFPAPEQLAVLDEATLRADARVGYRAPFILLLAQAVASGALDLEALRVTELPTLQLRKQLMTIKGIGPYAAANLLMLLGRSDYIPVDSWALKMVSQEWHANAPITPVEVEAAFARWGEYKGLAYWFWDWAKPG
jgi:3-methyladenine DNA glycosylase/8-oxoguanine DNA glycosylase